MVRQDKEINDVSAIEAVMAEAPVCRLGLVDDGLPYIVPMHFAYREKCLYFHTGKKGRKIDILRKNNRVCFEMDLLEEVIRADEACRWTTRYRSVIGYGRAQMIDDPEAVRLAMDLLMGKYAGPERWNYAAPALKQTLILLIAIESVTGKASPAAK